MRSIILIVLVALCHNALGVFTSAELGNFQVYENGRKPFFLSPSRKQVTEIDETITSDDGTLIEKVQNEKINCDCKKGVKPRITFGPEQVVKGKPETFIHHQPKIIVRQPDTHVRIEHPPTIIQPSTIVFRRNGKIIKRPVIYQHLPQDVQTRPVYVNLVRPIEKKVLVDDKRALPTCAKGGKEFKLDIENTGAEFDTFSGENFSEDIEVKETSGGERLKFEETVY